MEFMLGQSSLHPRTLRSSYLVRVISNQKPFNQICRCQIQGISSKGQNSTKKISVHVVKEGQTLTSISKLYGVPISDIAAANENIINVDLVFEGQQLNIPSFTTRELHMAKSTGYFLVVVPLIAFCIRCIMGALHRRIDEELKRKALTESERYYHGSKNMRWKSALRDLRDPEELDADSGPDDDHLMDDQDQMDSNDLSHSYSKLERDYEKFLSECGMSKWGYWRGGSPK